MGSINYRKIYEKNQDEWKALTREPQKYEALLAGHYSDSNHFVYELLQNAEDEKASTVVIEFYKDRLVFYHDGEPFDESDVIGVSSMLMGTKDRNDAQTIGRFGMGFKSVFKYTDQPEIYSDHEAFVIKNYLLPEELEADWDYQSNKKTLIYPDKEMAEGFYPFADSEHLTRIIIPFYKRNGHGEKEYVNGADVLQKLKSLTGEILLFLTWIKDLYWINKETKEYAHITKDQVEDDSNLITCRISSLFHSEEISRYLKYKRIFEHPEMSSAEVSVAYRVNPQVRSVLEIEDSPVWVYFPTREDTSLPLLIHGSFETAVSREKLMTDSHFNRDLFDQLGDLIAESMLDLAERKLITQNFLRRIIIPAFQDESSKHTIEGLKEKITAVFKKECIFPDRRGKYRRTSELAIPVPFTLADFKETALFAHSFDNSPHFVAFNHERERNFTEYFVWMYTDLNIPLFTLDRWVEEMCKVPANRPIYEHELEDLQAFYHFLSDYRENLFLSDSRFSSQYELSVIASLSIAWEKLRLAPVILNSENEMVRVYNEKGRLQIYLNASGKDYALKPSETVSDKVSGDFRELFLTAFKIPVYDNWQYVKENILPKYTQSEGRSVRFDDLHHFEEEYLRDFQKILSAIEDNTDSEEVLSLLKKANIIKIISLFGAPVFCPPSTAFISESKEGIDLKIYYAPIPEELDITSSLSLLPVDEAFYSRYNVPVSALEKLGVIMSPVTDGPRADFDGRGDGYWIAQGDYCPYLMVDGLPSNMLYIQSSSDDRLAKQKSAECLKLLQSIYKKLTGKVRKRKTNPYYVEERAQFTDILKVCKWVYGKDGIVHSPKTLSRFELNEEVYGDIYISKEAGAAIGFIEKEEDKQSEAFDYVDALDKRSKTIMFRQLAKELGYDLSGLHQSETSEEKEDTFDSSDQFEYGTWQSEGFPKRRIRNIERLIEHVRQEFFCADPVRYQKVLRQIRTSKSPKSIRAYALGMYQNESDTQICQMCRKPALYVDVTEIANYGIEMPQLNLCLCRNCSSRYKQFRDGNKERFKEEMTKALREIDVTIPSEDYEIALSSENSLFFTQTHLAEIKEILSLLEQYGIPGEDNLKEEGFNSYDKNPSYDRTHDRSTEKREKQNPKTMEGEYKAQQYDHEKDISINLQDERHKRPLTRQNHQEVFSSIKQGGTVNHKTFGSGTITYVEPPYIGVYFQSAGEKKFRFPDAFKNGYLEMC